MEILIKTIANYLIPIVIIATYIYKEIQIKKLIQSCGEGIKLYSGGLFSTGSSLFHVSIILYCTTVFCMGIFSLIFFTSLIKGFYIHFLLFAVIMALFVDSSTLSIYIGNSGLLVGSKYYHLSMIDQIIVKDNDHSNPFYKEKKTIYIMLYSSKKKFRSYINYEDIDRFNHLYSNFISNNIKK